MQGPESGWRRLRPRCSCAECRWMRCAKDQRLPQTHEKHAQRMIEQAGRLENAMEKPVGGEMRNTPIRAFVIFVRYARDAHKDRSQCAGRFGYDNSSARSASPCTHCVLRELACLTSHEIANGKPCPQRENASTKLAATQLQRLLGS
jgi:hypothetical protein